MRSIGIFRRSAAPSEPDLSEAQERILDGLRHDGVAVSTFNEIVDDAALWSELEQDIAGFVDETERILPTLSPAEIAAAFEKSFLVRRLRKRKDDRKARMALLGPSDPWVRMGVSSSVLGIVNAYRGAMMRLVDLDNWYTIPSADADARIASQQWHRDPWEDHILKVFTYFSNVDTGAGPFEYVRGSAPGGKYGSLWPWEENGIYPPPDEFAQAIDGRDCVSLTGPPGTMIFCNTAGFHRGGFALTTPRVLCYHTYISAAAQERHPRKFEVDWSGAADDLPAESRYALE